MALPSERKTVYMREYMKKYYRKNKEKWSRDDHDWYESYGRRYDLKQRFGITPEQYDAILESQNGVCAICMVPPGKRRLAVDHNHETGRVRGLLCHHCNLTLGRVRDSIGSLRAMIDYLERV